MEGKGVSAHLRIKAKVLFLFEEEVKHKFPHKVRVQCVIDDFCPAKLEKREREKQICSELVNLYVCVHIWKLKLSRSHIESSKL